MKLKWIFAAAGLALALGLTAAAVAPRGAPVTSTECVTVLDTDVCTWIVTDRGDALELGATIPYALIESVPTDVGMVWPPEPLANVQFPAEAQNLLGIAYLGLNWEAHGHPPATFLTQHFDFHFYNVTEQEIAEIDCADATKPAAIPRPYALPDIDVPGMGTLIGLCVPAMGMHAMPSDEVDDTEPFDATMLVGYYGAEPIFFEPMVSRALLLTKNDFTLDMPEVDGLPRGVRYPRAFRAEFDEGAQAYRLIFTGF